MSTPLIQSTNARRVVLSAAVLVLTALAWGALYGGIRQLPRAETVGQRVETWIQIAGGVLSAVTVLTCFRHHEWTRWLRAVWATSLVLAAGLSGLVWGPPMPLIALLLATGALFVVLVLAWAMRAGGVR